MKAEYNADEMVEVVENVSEGSEITISYDSANAGDIQEKTLTVLEAGESWNGKVWEIKMENEDGHYKLVCGKDNDSPDLNRIQYEWQRGERRRQTGSRRLIRNAVDSKGVVKIEIDVGNESGEVENVENKEDGVTIVKFTDGFQAAVEEYDDAKGGYVAAGGKYVTEGRRREMETKLGYTVDP